jgi:hypothetical protein
MSVKFVEAVNQKDRALQTAIRAFGIIRFGGKLEPHEAKYFIDLCSLALPMRYRFPRETWEQMERAINEKLQREGKP